MPEESSGDVPYLDKSSHGTDRQISTIKNQVIVPEDVRAVVLAGMPMLEKHVGSPGVQHARMEQDTVEGCMEKLCGNFFQR